MSNRFHIVPKEELSGLWVFYLNLPQGHLMVKITIIE